MPDSSENALDPSVMGAAQSLSFDAWLTLGVIAVCFVALLRSRVAPDVILLAGVAVLLLMGVLNPSEALAGMANEGMVTVGVLFIVARALSQTGVVNWISQRLLGRPGSDSEAQIRLMAPVAALSSILNNTPVVAMLVPAVKDWAKRNNLNVSQLMIPLSYAAIVGGTCTLVGTSTNLVINGMLVERFGDSGLGMFDLAWVGIPCVIVVLVFTVLLSRWLLPHNSGALERFDDVRQYVVEMLVEEGSPLVGMSIEQAGLRQLPGMFLVEIQRTSHVLSAVSPTELLRANDRLIFAGDVRSVVDLKNIHGLVVAENQVFKLGGDNANRRLVEVVISPSFPELGKTVKEMNFRKTYQAAIIAVTRNGEHLKTRIGDIQLTAGDTLLVEAHSEFVDNQKYRRDFLLVSEIEDSAPVRHELRVTAAVIMLAMVLLVSFGLLSMFEGALLAAGAMIATRCISISEGRQSVDWQVLLVIAASIGLGSAMQKTGAAQVLAETIIGAANGSALASLIAVFVVTAAFSAVISNLAAAVLLFPVAMSAASQLGVNMEPFAVTLMIAASACFATPIGYQTNLMVYGPGDYQFSDFLKLGIPLTILVGITTVVVVPMVWPF